MFSRGKLHLLLYSILYTQKLPPGHHCRGRIWECRGLESPPVSSFFLIILLLVPLFVSHCHSHFPSHFCSRCLSHAHTHTFTHSPSHLGPYAVWYGAVSPPGLPAPHNDADGHPGSSRGSAATHAPNCP